MGKIYEIAKREDNKKCAINLKKYIDSLEDLSIEDKLLKLLESKSRDQKRIDALNRNPFWDFSKECKKAVFAESSHIILIPFSDKFKDLYIKTREDWIALPKYYEKDKKLYGDDHLWKFLNTFNHFTCAAYNKDNEYMGYIGMSNICGKSCEISIELMDKYCYKGMGPEIFQTFVNRIHEITGRKKFKLRIEVDNFASQAFADKIGAKYVGLERVFFQTNKDEEEYEDSHLDLIDEQLITLAEKIDVEPKKLLTHVLKYYYIVKQSNDQRKDDEK